MKKTITRLVAVCLSGILALQTPLFQINAYGMEPYAPKGEVEYPGDIDPLFHLANLDLCDDNQQITLGNVEFYLGKSGALPALQGNRGIRLGCPP